MWSPPCWFHRLVSLLSFVLSAIGAVVFCLGYHNIHAGIWCGLVSLLSLATLYLHLLVKNDTLEVHQSHQSLQWWMYLGLIGAPVAGLAALTYLILALVNHIPVMPVGNSLILGAVQAALAVKWNLTLAYFARKYQANLQGAYIGVDEPEA